MMASIDNGICHGDAASSYAYLHKCNDGDGFDVGVEDGCHFLDLGDATRRANLDYLVRVKAQVMTRDDSTGGWVPMGGGGMSIIGLQRRLDLSKESADLSVEYLIQGQRIADHAIVLNCPLKRDLQYTKANPTFHHWQTGSKKFGLTFQSSADAFAFEKSIYKAADSLQEHPVDVKSSKSAGDDVFVMLHFSHGGGAKDSLSQSASLVSLLQASPSVHLIGQPSVREACHRAAGLKSHVAPPRASTQNKSGRTYVTSHGAGRVRGVDSRLDYLDSELRDWSEDDNDINRKIELSEDSLRMDDDVTGMDSSYVQFAKADVSTPPHDYCYPMIGSSHGQTFGRQQLRQEAAHGYHTGGEFCPPQSAVMSQGGRSAHQRADPQLQRLDSRFSCAVSSSPPRAHPKAADDRVSSSSHSVASIPSAPPRKTRSQDSASNHCDRRKGGKQPRKPVQGERATCMYCKEVFTEGVVAGGCPDAPSCVMNSIEAVSCACAAHALLYHCTADTEGAYDLSCRCGSARDCRKWTLLALLSLVVPCLWCYYPLLGCHRCAARCGFCVGRHRAV